MNTTEVDKILDSVLGLCTTSESEIEVPFIPSIGHKKFISEEVGIRNFDPDINVMVAKEQLNITDQLEGLSEMKLSLETIKEDIQFIKQRFLTATPKKRNLSLTKEERSIKRKSAWLLKGKKV